MDDRTTGDSPHEILLALAGRIDDDLLGWCRELVAVGEDGRALELITATLVADGTTLPPRDRAAVVAAARTARTDLDADAALLPAGAGDETPHRFAAGRGAEDLAAAVGALPERLVAGCRTWVTFRTTPAGSAPGPLPQPVVLVEVDADDPRPVDVLAYQLGTACARVGVATAAVEVVVAGVARTEYQQAALLTALPVHGSADAPPTDPYGTAAYRPDPSNGRTDGGVPDRRPFDGAVDTDSFTVQSSVEAPLDDEEVAEPEPVVEGAPSVTSPGPRPVPRRGGGYAHSRFSAGGYPGTGGPDIGTDSAPRGEDLFAPSRSSADAEPDPSGDQREVGAVEPDRPTDDLRALPSGLMDRTAGTAPAPPAPLTSEAVADGSAAAGTFPDGTVPDGPSDDGTVAGRSSADRPAAPGVAPTGGADAPRAPVTPLRVRTEPPRPRPTAVPDLPRPGPQPTPLARRGPLASVTDAPGQSLPGPEADTPALASIGDPFSGPIERTPLSSSRPEPTIDADDPLGLGRLPLPAEPLPDEDDFPAVASESSAADSWLADWISGDWAMSRSATTSDPLGTAGADEPVPLVHNTHGRDADAEAGPSGIDRAEVGRSEADAAANRSDGDRPDADPSDAADPFVTRADDHPIPDPSPVDDRMPDGPPAERRTPGRQLPVRPAPFEVEHPEPPVHRPAPGPVPAPQAETPMQQTAFVLPPESVARLSEADRELLARLQTGLGELPRPRVTRRAGIGGPRPVPPAPNGHGPPDLAG